MVSTWKKKTKLIDLLSTTVNLFSSSTNSRHGCTLEKLLKNRC